MIRVPLYYSGIHVGDAQADESLSQVTELVTFRVRVSKKVRRLSQNRPDVIAALLREDPVAFKSTRPYTLLFQTQVLLSHIVLRPEIQRLIIDRELTPQTHSHNWCLAELERIRHDIGRVVFVNQDHTDCRLENLREVLMPTESE